MMKSLNMFTWLNNSYLHTVYQHSAPANSGKSRLHRFQTEQGEKWLGIGSLSCFQLRETEQMGVGDNMTVQSGQYD